MKPEGCLIFMIFLAIIVDNLLYLVVYRVLGAIWEQVV